MAGSTAAGTEAWWIPTSIGARPSDPVHPSTWRWGKGARAWRHGFRRGAAGGALPQRLSIHESPHSFKPDRRAAAAPLRRARHVCSMVLHTPFTRTAVRLAGVPTPRSTLSTDRPISNAFTARFMLRCQFDENSDSLLTLTLRVLRECYFYINQEIEEVQHIKYSLAFQFVNVLLYYNFRCRSKQWRQENV